jgi:hypothetical protein
MSLIDVFVKSTHTPRESFLILDITGGDNSNYDFLRVFHD